MEAKIGDFLGCGQPAPTVRSANTSVLYSDISASEARYVHSYLSCTYGYQLGVQAKPAPSSRKGACLARFGRTPCIVADVDDNDNSQV